MTAVDVQWAPEMPPEVKAMLGPVLHRCLPLVPPWVRELRVEFGTGMEEASAEIYCSYQYRWARMVVGPAWLCEDERGRLTAVAHELSHIVQEPLQAFVENLLEHIGDEGHRALLRTLWVQAMESTTTDWGWILGAILPPPKA